MKSTHLAAIACASLVLGACAVSPIQEEWEALPSHPSLPAAFLTVDSDGIAANCGTHPGLYVFGCAKRLFDSRACLVFTRANPQRWLLEHEQRHCDGWDHVAMSSEFPGGTALFAVPMDAQGQPVAAHAASR